MKYIYLLNLLLIPMPSLAYYNHNDGIEFLLGVLLLIIIIPVFKLLGYLLLMILSNKWTWIIGGTLLFLFIMSSIEKDKLSKRNNNYSPYYQQQNYNYYQQNRNISPTISKPQKTLEKKQKTETYRDICSNCLGTGVTTCHHCGGDSFIEKVCTFCKGTGGEKEFRCLSCSGSGTNSITGARCFSCSGTGYQKSYCFKCSGTGKISDLCEYCNYFNGSKISCSQCDGTGYIYRSRIVDYYE